LIVKVKWGWEVEQTRTTGLEFGVRETTTNIKETSRAAYKWFVSGGTGALESDIEETGLPTCNYSQTFWWDSEEQ
jgi:hypothetical protein